MTNHQRKTVTLAERMERKRAVQAKRQAEKAARQAKQEIQKRAGSPLGAEPGTAPGRAWYPGLNYDYTQIDEEYRSQVQAATMDIRGWQRSTIAIGKTLLAIKDVLPHGQFEDWWQSEFGLSERMVQSLLTVARVYGNPANPRRVAGLSDGALYLLAAPSTPESARAEVEQLVIQGNAPGRAQVKAIIDAHKREPTGHRTPRLVKPKQLPGPVDDAIEAEYTVVPKHEFIFAAQPMRGDQVQPIIGRSVALKLQDALLHRIFRALLTPDEQDELLVALTRALEE